MKKFEGIYFFSDMDGTMITADFQLPQRNIDAIKYFVENGGHFALATGRGIHPNTLKAAENIAVNFPCIMLNGGLLYDLSTQTEINAEYLVQEEAIPLIKELVKEFADKYSIAVWLNDHSIQLGMSSPHMLKYGKGTMEDINKPVMKIVIGHELGEQQQMVDFVMNRVSDEFYITTASPRFVEVMPKGISKGWGLEWLINHYGLDRKKVIAMGDYYNDMSMLTVNGIRAFCPENAADDIKKVCERTFCHVNDGAIADAIEFLESEL